MNTALLETSCVTRHDANNAADSALGLIKIGGRNIKKSLKSLPDTGNPKLVDGITDKRGYGARWDFLLGKLTTCSHKVYRTLPSASAGFGSLLLRRTPR